MNINSGKTKLFLLNISKTAVILLFATCINLLLTNKFATFGNASEIYILSVLLISLNTTGYAWGILAAIVSVLCANYFFTYPYTNFNFTLEGYPVTFFVMLTASIATSALSGRIKKQREFERERSRLADERQKMAVEAEKEKMRGNLLRAISHDLRTPLTGILAASNALIDNDELISSQGRKELLEGINEDAEWLLRMVENVLSVTRISGGAPSLKKVDEPLDEVFSQVVSKARKRYPNINLSVSMPDEVTLIPMDEMLIVQVLINLVDNAILHGRNNKVELSAKTVGNFVEISVRDYGRGIPECDLDKLFEGFVSRDKDCTDSTRGLGIGLSICKTIVEGHGGNIHAKNMPDAGAYISFTLPITEVTSYAE